MSNYLIELSIIHCVLILAYYLVLRKEQQYGKMRAFLLSSALLSIVIPFLKFPKLFPSNPEVVLTAPLEVMPIQSLTISPAVESGWSPGVLFIYLYLVITGILLFRTLCGFVLLLYLARKSHLASYNGGSIRRVPGLEGSFTFFNWIFVGTSIDNNQEDYKVILQHEQAHASLGHTYDLILIELFRAIFWWLPSAWYVQKEIKKIHEFQADAFALKTVNIDLYSSILISSTLKSNGLILASSFHDGLIFNRINAMKQKAKNVRPWKVAFLMTLCTLLVILLACSEEKNDATIQEAEYKSQTAKQDPEREVFAVVQEMPDFEGGMEAFYRYVTNEIRYPREARQNSIEGQVDVQFVVEKDGILSDIKAIKGIGAGCDAEAVRVIKNSPSFIPGSQRGKKVRVQMVMPIQFKLKPGTTNPDNTTQGNVIIGKVDSEIQKLGVKVHYDNGTINGIVRSPEGDPLPGANIVIDGTNYGTVSDLDGTFSIDVKPNENLTITFVGYAPVQIKN